MGVWVRVPLGLRIYKLPRIFSRGVFVFAILMGFDPPSPRLRTGKSLCPYSDKLHSRRMTEQTGLMADKFEIAGLMLAIDYLLILGLNIDQLDKIAVFCKMYQYLNRIAWRRACPPQLSRA